MFYGRCPHRGALLADGSVVGPNLICGLHGWDFRVDSGVSKYNNDEALPRFSAYIADNQVNVNRIELDRFEREHPQPFRTNEYLGDYADAHPDPIEPYIGYIKHLSQHGLTKIGHHGSMGARACGHSGLSDFTPADLSTFSFDMHRLAGIFYAGITD